MKAAARMLLKIFLILVLLLGVLGLGSYLFSENFVWLNGKVYSVGTTQLDFSGKPLPDLDGLARLKYLEVLDLTDTGLTLGEHEWLQSRLPNCEIRWQVPFGTENYAPDVKEIRLDHLTAGDVIMLDDLAALQTVDLRGCRDYEAILALAERRPECRLLYTVELGKKSWDQDTEVLQLQDGEIKELESRLPLLPKVQSVTLFGALPPVEALQALQKKFESILFSWQIPLAGKSYPSSLEDLDLSLRSPEELQGLPEVLPYFEGLKRLDLRGTVFSEEQREAIQKICPQAEILWNYDLNGTEIAPDTRELDLSGREDLTMEALETMILYVPGLEKLILCNCGLPSEELAALNEKLENVRIVWNVLVGGRDTRTDETYFAPNKWGLKMTDANIQDLRYCTDMVCVDIGHSKMVTSCDWAENMQELRYLILADSNVRDLSPLENLKKLKYLELFLIPGQDLSPLKGCTALEDLNLCYVYTDPEPIREMTWLKRLWWSGCWPARNALSEALPDTEKNFTSASSTGEGWREGKLYYEMRNFIGMGYMKG